MNKQPRPTRPVPPIPTDEEWQRLQEKCKPPTPFESTFAHLTEEERGRLVFKYEPSADADEPQDEECVVRVRLEDEQKKRGST